MAEETLRLRALMGRWDDQEAIFAGAVSAETYDAIRFQEGEEAWQLRLQEWKDRAPHGTDGWREVWVDLPVSLAIFEAPELQAEVKDA